MSTPPNMLMQLLNGTPSPYLNPQEQAIANQQRRMAMIAALMKGAAPRPQGTGNTFGDIGNALAAGQQASGQSVDDLLKAHLMQMQMRKAQYTEVPAGGTLLGPDNQPVFTAPAAETGINSRFRTPQVLESGRVGVIDGQTGRLKYADSGDNVPASDPVSAHLQVITLPDGSMQIVDMRRGLGGSGAAPATAPAGVVPPNAPVPSIPPVAPRAASLVSPTTALSGAQARAAATAEGTTEGTARGTAVANMPQVQYTAQQALATADQLLTHPGRSTATGVSSRLDPRNYVPGTDAYNFNVLLNQAKGQIFLDAYQALKGGGQITEIEGQKAEQAKARMDRAQSDEEFVQALKDYKASIQRGLELAQQKTEIGKTDVQKPKRVKVDAAGNVIGN